MILIYTTHKEEKKIKQKINEKKDKIKEIEKFTQEEKERDKQNSNKYFLQTLAGIHKRTLTTICSKLIQSKNFFKFPS
jgi:hypothetical protein